MRILCALITCLLVTAASADTAARADRAAQGLAKAGDLLAQANSARDRVAALTQTVRAYEDGLAAVRAGLRDTVLERDALLQSLQGREAEISALLGALHAISTSTGPIQTLHPHGPTGAVRAGLLMSGMTPALDAKAQDLRDDLTDLSALTKLQQKAMADLDAGLRGAQEARVQLNQAIADRVDLPRRFADDPIRSQVLIASAETLDAFATTLVNSVPYDRDANVHSVSARKGLLETPVRGVWQPPAEDRAGQYIETTPGALVTSPANATILYAGPFQDQSQVVLLEPHPDLLIVLLGLGTVFGQAGDIVPAGTPLGLMGEKGTFLGQNGSTRGEVTGHTPAKALYIEVRLKTVAEVPAAWFVSNKG